VAAFLVQPVLYIVCSQGLRRPTAALLRASILRWLKS